MNKGKREGLRPPSTNPRVLNEELASVLAGKGHLSLGDPETFILAMVHVQRRFALRLDTSMRV